MNDEYRIAMEPSGAAVRVEVFEQRRVQESAPGEPVWVTVQVLLFRELVDAPDWLDRLLGRTFVVKVLAARRRAECFIRWSQAAEEAVRRAMIRGRKDGA